MNKFRKKIFWTIFGILTTALLILLIAYNLKTYLSAKDLLVKAVAVKTMNPFNPQYISNNDYVQYVINNFFNGLFSSIILFFVFAGVFFIISKYLTNWIVAPVEDSFKKQKEFIADASHELKTPLSVIIASNDALISETKENKWTKNIKAESNRMNDLITKLLVLATTEKANQENYTSQNLSKIVELSSLTFEGRAIEKNIEIVLSIQKNINLVMNDGDIKQLVEILLDNAIKHSKDNEKVHLKLYKNKQDIVMSVSNIGDAIPKGEEEKIFERFYRSDKARDSKENRYGLGLAIAKNIVENHNGIISAKSYNGVTTFTVIFK